MLRMVNVEEWDLTALPDAARQERLLSPPSAESLLAGLIDEARVAAPRGEISLRWQQACHKPGYFRAEAQIPVTKYAYDALFNGRSGYRAQYYLSPEEGLLYNRQIIDGLIPAVHTAYQHTPLQITFAMIERSLRTPHAKIWVFENAAEGKHPFCEAAADTLNPARWAKYVSLGRRCPLPDYLLIDLKGSFIDLLSPDFFVYEGKADRACDLYHKGYT